MILTHRQSRRHIPIGSDAFSLAKIEVTCIAIVVFACSFSACFAQEEILPLFKAQEVTIVDGDTIRCKVEVWDDIWVHKSIRSTYDTWESFRTRHSKDFQGKSDAWWKEEQRKGELAKIYLKELLANGTFYLSPANQSTYGRDVCHFYYVERAGDGKIQSVMELMKTKGHLRDE